MKEELNVRDQVRTVFSLKIHCIDEIENKFLLNQSNQIKGFFYGSKSDPEKGGLIPVLVCSWVTILE